MWRELVERGDQSGLPEVDLRKVVNQLRKQIASRNSTTPEPQAMPIYRDHQLKTARCILRHVSEEDIPHVFAPTRFEGFNDGMTWDPPQGEAELLKPYHRNCDAWQTDTDYVFTIEAHAGEFIGRISIGRTATEGEDRFPFGAVEVPLATRVEQAGKLSAALKVAQVKE